MPRFLSHLAGGSSSVPGGCWGLEAEGVVELTFSWIFFFPTHASQPLRPCCGEERFFRRGEDTHPTGPHSTWGGPDCPSSLLLCRLGGVGYPFAGNTTL